jgi:hypothetical protein
MGYGLLYGCRRKSLGESQRMLLIFSLDDIFLGLGGICCVVMLIIGTITIDLYDNVVVAFNEGNFEYALDNHDNLVVLFYWDTAVYTFSVVFPVEG